MRRIAGAWLTAGLIVCAPAARAQEPPPPIGPVVLDVHGTVPKFPSNAQLADSRSLALNELPGVGLGLHAAAHVYVFRWKAVTFGLGGDLTMARAHTSGIQSGDQIVQRAVTERFTHFAPELSFNFGTGDGWSYISGGIGPSIWRIVPDGALPAPADQERLRTIDYGGGARWFIRRHLAFSFDVRFFAIDPGSVGFGVGSPRTTFIVAGAGISLKP
jgi:hypothetical protein